MTPRRSLGACALACVCHPFFLSASLSFFPHPSLAPGARLAACSQLACFHQMQGLGLEPPDTPARSLSTPREGEGLQEARVSGSQHLFCRPALPSVPPHIPPQVASRLALPTLTRCGSSEKPLCPRTSSIRPGATSMSGIFSMGVPWSRVGSR